MINEANVLHFTFPSTHCYVPRVAVLIPDIPFIIAETKMMTRTHFRSHTFPVVPHTPIRTSATFVTHRVFTSDVHVIACALTFGAVHPCLTLVVNKKCNWWKIRKMALDPAMLLASNRVRSRSSLLKSSKPSSNSLTFTECRPSSTSCLS